MRSHILLATVTLTACAPADTEQQSDSTPAQGVAQEPAPVTLEQFRQMQWIVGSWRGSGGAYPSFFEEYHAVDDSTIQMRALSDSTFRAATDSSWIEFRNGAIRKRGIDRNYVVVALTPTACASRDRARRRAATRSRRYRQTSGPRRFIRRVPAGSQPST